MLLTSYDRQGVDFQGIRFLTGAARIVLMEVIDLKRSIFGYRGNVANTCCIAFNL
jgi:hypothetical protein